MVPSLVWLPISNKADHFKILKFSILSLPLHTINGGFVEPHTANNKKTDFILLIVYISSFSLNLSLSPKLDLS
jgi:hypothetical protein